MKWNNESCEREPDIRRMVRSGGDDPALQEHAAHCAVCGDTLAIAAWMQELAALPVEHPVPDAAYLWWKAELLRRWDAQRQAVAPLERGEPVQVGIGLVGTMALLVWIWRQTRGFATVAAEAGWVDTFTVTAIVSVGVLLVIAVVSLRDVLLETNRKERI